MIKKITAALMAIALLISSGGFAAGKQRMTVTVSAVLESNHSVGNEWTVACTMNGTPISEDLDPQNEKLKYIKKPEKEKTIGEGTVQLTAGDELEIYTLVTEYDKDYPDDGTDTTTRTVSSADLRNGFTVEISVTVIENAGRYEGNAAVWRITYQFAP